MLHNATKKQLEIKVEFQGKEYKVGNLLSDNEKLKLADTDYIVYGVQLAPGDIAGHEVCPSRTPECSAACIFTSGRGRFTSTQLGRIKRKLAWFQQRNLFKARLIWEIRSKLQSATKKGLRLAIRLNVFSDIVWEKVFPELFTMFPNVQFYDYTKIQARVAPNWKLPANYHLTFSRSETTTDEFIADLINRGINVAIPFNVKKNELPQTHLGFTVINGDKHDSRFMDPTGVIVGLSVKGDGKKQASNANSFIVNPNATSKRFLLSLV